MSSAFHFNPVFYPTPLLLVPTSATLAVLSVSAFKFMLMLFINVICNKLDLSRELAVRWQVRALMKCIAVTKRDIRRSLKVSSSLDFPVLVNRSSVSLTECIRGYSNMGLVDVWLKDPIWSTCYHLQTKLFSQTSVCPWEVGRGLRDWDHAGQRLLLDRGPLAETPWTETPLYGKEWAVRILLECVLVFKLFHLGPFCIKFWSWWQQCLFYLGHYTFYK